MFEIKLNDSIDILDSINRNIQFNENQAPLFSFKIDINNELFNKINRFKDTVQIYKEEVLLFEGRVCDISKSMDSEGLFWNEILCEGFLNYLIDSTVGVWEVHPADLPLDSPSYAEANYDTKKFLRKVLNNHNAKVEDKKKIYLGNVTLVEPIYCMTNRESSLNVIQEKLINRKGGFLNLRKSNNKFYLDYLKENPIKDESEFTIGLNIKDIHLQNSLKNICTRIVGIGSEGLITSTFEDKELLKEFGVFEQVHEWPDVTIQENLDKKVQEKLKDINNNIDIVSINALDLSYLDDNFTTLKLSQNINVVCEPLNYSKKHRVIHISLNLDEPWNSYFNLNNPEVSQISSNNNVIQETNDNKLEILQLNGRLIQKVSSSEFQSYREQTDKSIKERVTGSEFETYKTQTDKYIGDQVKSLNNNLSTLKEQTEKELSQTVKEKEFKTKFIHNIEGFDFVIGDKTPLSIRKDKLTMEFDDGTTCSMGKNGFYYKDGGSNYSYKSMVQRGSVSKVKSGDTVRINLPSNFRKKDYEISWWTGNIFPAHEGDLLFSANSELVRQNKSEGWFEIRANMMVRNPNTSDRTPFMRGSLNVVWIAIA